MDIVDELSAERDIRSLVARYAQLADDAAAEDWAALFTPTGSLRTTDEQLTGRDELAPWLAKVNARKNMRHLFANLVVTVESPTSARGTTDLGLLMLNREDRWVVAATQRYRDRYQKDGGVWLFAERVME
jgi:hypothetical protein